MNKDELPELPNELDFEQWYCENAFHFERDPIGSRDCELQRKAWHAALATIGEMLAWIEEHGTPPFNPLKNSYWNAVSKEYDCNTLRDAIRAAMKGESDEQG